MSFQTRDGKKTKKHRIFCSPSDVRSPNSTKLGMVIEEVRAILGGLKHVPSDSVTPLGQGTLIILGENAPHVVKPL